MAVCFWFEKLNFGNLGMNNEASIIKIKTAIEYEKSRKAPPVDFPPLPDIPVARYTEQKFYELEEKYLWQKEHSENLTGTENQYRPSKIKKNLNNKKYETWNN